MFSLETSPERNLSALLMGPYSSEGLLVLILKDFMNSADISLKTRQPSSALFFLEPLEVPDTLFWTR